ncbi:MAG: hypothetical protein M3Z37_08375, partial [Candidatus Eremiobacteraeota bacterium]|nr:hypothetical protein [Candidatus Eremiobacteraeota bacterium]
MTNLKALKPLHPSRFVVALIIVASVALAGCGHSSNVNSTSAGNGAADTTAGNGPVAIAAGTDFYGKLQQPISSKTSHEGDAFQLQHSDTLLHKDPALRGAVIDGHLENVQAAGPLRKPGMTIVFDSITLADGTKDRIDAKLVSLHAFDAKTHHLRTIGMMIGGAMAGHVLRNHTGKGSGMLGAAGGYVLSQTMKTDISVPAGTVLEVRLL